jgi:peptidoglycan/xylan/chitin deacetylase (PgdA/CDA1 family)
MQRLIKEILAILIRCSGAPFLIREVLRRNRVTILMYHDPTPEVFAKHLKYLSRRYHFITLNQCVNTIHTRDGSKLPPKSLVVTFDDGYAGNYQLLPLFKAYNIHPTIYLCSQIIDTHRHLWFRTDGVRERQQKGYRESLKKLPNRERLARLKTDYNFDPQKEFPNRQTLNRAELNEMTAHVDFGGHTQFHPILTTCTDDELRQELEGCKQDLEALLGQPCEHFCYPNGDYTEREIDAVKRCGYQSARTSDCGWNDTTTDPYRLKAMDIADDATLNGLIAQMSGAFQYLKYALKGSFNGTHPTNMSVKRKS